MATPIPCPDEFLYMTAADVAECQVYDDPNGDLYIRLWEVYNDAHDPTPIGGDGSDGTTEEPQIGGFGDTMEVLWCKLTEKEQRALVDGLSNS